MAHTATDDELVRELATGFETLQEEYQKLFAQHHTLERKLATAREQYNELAMLYGSGDVATPPLSLSPRPDSRRGNIGTSQSVSDILEHQNGGASQDAAGKVRAAGKATRILRVRMESTADNAAHGVRIWSGRAADKPDAGSTTMPSISESPLEQDFTIEGKPSKLGCPFASMANKRLSSHAASVLSRYNQGSVGVPSTPISSVSRVNGRDSFSRRGSRRASFADPVKAEICGFADSGEELTRDEGSLQDHQETPVNAEPGVCPIRFLDQHSPEEVATYFEKHKHELPRSHEVCVKRYQSNEKQIQELDKKYGSLVSMIQGLGAKHKDMLPQEPDDGEEGEHDVQQDSVSAEKVLKWASSVSAQKGAADPADEEADEERKPHFERPLRDIRVGESPSRPWGISVPAKYLEQAASEQSSRPAQVEATPAPPIPRGTEAPSKKPVGKCPFQFDKVEPPAAMEDADANQGSLPQAQPIFNAPNNIPEHHARDTPGKSKRSTTPQPLVFTGPVFIGYSTDDAARILRESGLATRQ